MEYSDLKSLLINAWSRADQWEKRLHQLSQHQIVTTYNIINPALNAKVNIFPSDNAFAREGWEIFREIERLQKTNPEMADKIHMEVHYGK